MTGSPVAGRPLRVLLAEPWYGGSHREWADGYAAHSAHDVLVVGLPDRLWRWRLLAGAEPLARMAEPLVAERFAPDGPDVVLISGLADVARFCGLARRWLHPTTPVVVFQHESQLAYPDARRVVDDPRAGPSMDHPAALADWASWSAADAVWFNSEFHRRAVLDRVDAWMASLPGDELALGRDAVIERFVTMGVGIDLPGAPGVAPSAEIAGPIILWPHRWEPDKDPEAFGRALERLGAAGLDFGLVLAGEVPSVGPDRRAELAARFADRVVACGPFDRVAYRSWLGRCDLVVSCAHHEFFGIAVAEAVAAGCVPVVPAGLVYEEVLRDDAVGYRPGRFGTALAEAVRGWRPRSDRVTRWSAAVARFSWTVQAPRYDAALSGLVARGRRDGD